ncbi:PREDICTED: caprin-1-like, partial [Rhagoletis zephyria]|uniref:caprin-1-like n=1 Tax=Rhagoletis zephyria TaxID=28612 RepID=UPI0008115A8D
MPAKDETKSAAVSGDQNGKGGKSSLAPNSNTDGPCTTIAELDTKLSTFFSKKLRNLEKRKTRLLEIKALEDKGQQLEAEQLVAVKKLDSVVEMIDLLKDIGKSVSDELSNYGKQQKKLQKREAHEKQIERNQQESERIKLWLNAQFILARLGSAKNDLLQGENGAVKLEQNQVDALEKLVEVLSVKSVDAIESSAEKVNHLLDGNKREFSTGVSYSVLKETIGKLVESKYFDTIAPVSAEPIVPDTNNTSVTSSADKEETVPLSEVSAPVTTTEEQRVTPVKKETIGKLVESKYFDTIAPVSAEPIVPDTNNTSVTSSADKEETVPLSEVSAPVTTTEEQRVTPVKKSEISAKVEQPKPSAVQQQPHPQQQQPLPSQQQQQQPSNVHLNQLCFMRNPENELLGHKDPAVVAVSSNFPYQPQLAQGGHPVSSVPNIVPPNTISSQHFTPHMYPPVSIPTQTFTNPSYQALIPGTNQYIPVTMTGQIPHQMQLADQSLQMRNPGQGYISPIPTNEKQIVDQVAVGDKLQQPQFSTDGGIPKDASTLQQTSQDGGDGKPIVTGGENGGGQPNGHFKRNNRGGGPRGSGNPR